MYFYSALVSTESLTNYLNVVLKRLNSVSSDVHSSFPVHASSSTPLEGAGYCITVALRALLVSVSFIKSILFLRILFCLYLFVNNPKYSLTVLRYTPGWQQNQVEFLLIKLSNCPLPNKEKQLVLRLQKCYLILDSNTILFFRQYSPDREFKAFR